MDIRGGTKGRAMAFYLGWLGSNPGRDFGFFQFRIAVNKFSLGARLFLITCLLSYLQSSVTIAKFINCYLTMYQEKEKRGRERPR